jgi:hypothetical protein
MITANIVLMEDLLHNVRDVNIDSVYYCSEVVLCLRERRGA